MGESKITQILQTFLSILTRLSVAYISMKFYPLVAHLHSRTFTNFGRFINMALIVLRVFIVFTCQVSSFTKSNCYDVIAKDEWLVIHPTLIHWIITFVCNSEVLRLATSPTEAETVPEFSDALPLIWSASLEKAISNARKDSSKQLQAYVSANCGHFEHKM